MFGQCCGGLQLLSNKPALGLLRPVIQDALRNNLVFRTASSNTFSPQSRGTRRPNRHRDERFRALRAIRNVKIDLQDFEFERRRFRDEVTPEEMREKMKKLGLNPTSPWQEKPLYISSTGNTIDPYVPPEGDGKASLISTSGAKQMTDVVKGKGKTMTSMRKIRSFHDDFDPRTWVTEAEEIYIAAHNALAAMDEDQMHRFVTEKCFPEMMHMAQRKTIRWKYLKTLEPPRVLHARHAEIVSKDNMFGQLTVRFHSQQSLAVYDRFGRLIHGNENVAKDVLEYCVFEKHLSNVYGTWRLHTKIIPDWMPRRDTSGRLTYLVQKAKPSESKDKDKGKMEEQQKPEEEEDDEKETLYDRFGKILKRG